jgi:hypothetical protein
VLQQPNDEPGSIEDEEQPSLELQTPLKGIDPAESAWTLVAHNKRVLKGWKQLVRDTPQNAINAYDWLRMHATKPLPGRCYALKHKNYAGCWCYEIGSGDRLYYKPDEVTKRAIVYYAGPHPKGGIPTSPK